MLKGKTLKGIPSAVSRDNSPARNCSVTFVYGLIRFRRTCHHRVTQLAVGIHNITEPDLLSHALTQRLYVRHQERLIHDAILSVVNCSFEFCQVIRFKAKAQITHRQDLPIVGKNFCLARCEWIYSTRREHRRQHYILKE